MQQAYKDYPIVSTGLKNTEEASQYILALPMHPYLGAQVQEKITADILEFL